MAGVVVLGVLGGLLGRLSAGRPVVWSVVLSLTGLLVVGLGAELRLT